MEDYKHITSPDPGGFQVRIVRNGKEHSRYFSHKQWGGREKALIRAQSWRDQMLVSLGKVNVKLTEKTILPTKRTTGIRGVSRSVQFDKRRGIHYLVYSVHWRRKGRPSTKTFYVGLIGQVDADEEFHAFRTAARFRWEYELSKEIGGQFYPERFKLWRSTKLYDEKLPITFEQVA